MAGGEPDRGDMRDAALRAAQSLAFLVGMGICFMLALGFAVGACDPTVSRPAIHPGERVNPNEAPAASLMRLPQIGPARARAIVAHRDRVDSQAKPQPAFRTADDLQRIKGIGPATVEGIRPWLQFGDLPGDGNEPPGR